MLGTLAGCLLGLLNGMRHALEPDHVAALSTILAGQRSARASVRFAATWGMGHALMLLVVGGALLVFRQNMPPALADAFELFVAFMLILLGARALHTAHAAGGRGPVTRHTHNGVAHAHAGAAEHVHLRGRTLARWPLVVGLIHGLAGSGTLAALAMANAESAAAGLAFMAIYGLGATLGMALLAGTMGVPLARVARSARGTAWLLALSGAFAVILGIVWGWPILARAMA